MADHTKIKIFALNAFGGGGPVASSNTLDFFTETHIRKCLERVAASRDVTPAGKVAAIAALGEMRQFREITIADVGCCLFEAFGGQWLVSDFIGRILPDDVGKRVYRVGDILQVENDEQRAARLAKRRA